MAQKTVTYSAVERGEEFERELLAASPDTCRLLLERFPDCVTEARIEVIAARARAASAVSPTDSLHLATITEELARVVQTPRGWAFTFWAQGAALRAHSRCEEAVEAFHDGARQANLADDPLLAARIPMGATETLAQLGRFEEALRLSDDLEDRLNALGVPEDAAKVVANAGNIYFQREDYGEALAHWERALAFFEARGEKVRVARLQMNVGNALTCLHRSPEAVRMYEAAREILEAAGMDLLVAGLDGDLGFLRFMAGQHNESLQAYARARRRFDTLDLPKEVAQADRETADVYLDLNLIPEAREMYERVLPVLRASGMSAESARSESGLAATLFRQDQHSEAFAALNRAEQAFQQEGNAVGVARTRLRRAAFLQWHGARTDDALNAQAQAKAALVTFRKHGLTLESLQARLLLAEMKVAGGGSPARTLQRLAGEAEPFPVLQWRVEAAQARAARNAGRHQIALNHYRLSVAEIEQARTVLTGNEFRIAFLQDKGRLYEEFLHLLLESDAPARQEAAFDVLEQSKSRTLRDARDAYEGAEEESSPERDALRQHLDSLRARLNWRYLSAENPDVGVGRLPSPGGNEPGDLRALERDYAEASRQWEILVSGNRAATAAASQHNLPEIQAALQDGEQIVAYATIDDEILAFGVDRSGLRVFRALASRREVERLVERLHFQWRKKEMSAYLPMPASPRSDNAAERILGELYAALIAPMEDFLTGMRLTVIPHGILHNLPFHAFFDGQNYLLDRLEIAYSPSCAVWLASQHREEIREGRSLIFSLSESGLAHTSVEASSLREILPHADVLNERAATLEALPRVGCFQYLHFATHAVFRKDNPLFSALQMADGWLFAHDLYRRRLDCSLVALSACHTGTGLVAPGDEVLGLVHGFLHAGARAVLVSQWAADDAATAALMRECYSRMAAGESRAAALRAAQQAVRQTWSHPYYWATFALIGGR